MKMTYIHTTILAYFLTDIQIGKCSKVRRNIYHIDEKLESKVALKEM